MINGIKFIVHYNNIFRVYRKFPAITIVEVELLLAVGMINPHLERARQCKKSIYLNEKWSEMEQKVNEQMKRLNSLNSNHKYTFRLQRNNLKNKLLEVFINNIDVSECFLPTCNFHDYSYPATQMRIFRDFLFIHKFPTMSAKEEEILYDLRKIDRKLLKTMILQKEAPSIQLAEELNELTILVKERTMILNKLNPNHEYQYHIQTTDPKKRPIELYINNVEVGEYLWYNLRE